MLYFVFTLKALFMQREIRKKMSCKVQENCSVNVKVSERVMDVSVMDSSVHAGGKCEEDCV